MPESHHLLLASDDPQELIELMLDSAATQIDPGPSAPRTGFQIALDAVSEPQPGPEGQRLRSLAANGQELVELLLSAAVAKIAPSDEETRAAVEVALDAVLSFEERDSAEVLAELRRRQPVTGRRAGATCPDTPRHLHVGHGPTP
jgi:hypothetical protein